MKKIPHLRWYILALIFLATVINYMDRQVISILAPVIADKKHFDLSDSTLAVIYNAFILAYTIGPSITGWIMDRIGSRRGYLLSSPCWVTLVDRRLETPPATREELTRRGLARYADFRGTDMIKYGNGWGNGVS